MDGGDWDLHAVVRGCAAAPKNTTATNDPTNKDPLPSMSFHQSSFDNFTGLIGDKNTNPFQGLQDAYQELCGDYPPPSVTGGGGVMSTAAFQPHQGTTVQDQVVNNPAYHQMNMQQDNIHDEFKNQGYGGFVSNAPVRPRRRKNQQLKMVRQIMTQEELSADSWAWRKYGQKPIKGSPYPRNYYRCSTSKGCTARKQVERSPEDPVIFIVSYTGEHIHPKPSHRSSLAGSTRNKMETKPNSMLLHQKAAAGTSTIISSSSSPAASSSSFSPCQPMVAVKENEDLENLDNSEELDQDEDDNCFGMIPANDDDDDDLYDHDHLGGGGEHSFSGGDW